MRNPRNNNEYLYGLWNAIRPLGIVRNRTAENNWIYESEVSSPHGVAPLGFLVGNQDLTYNSPGLRSINSGGLKKDVPLLNEAVVLKENDCGEYN
ncbi:hypothetical protein YC2023_086752 [Brassica napus]